MRCNSVLCKQGVYNLLCVGGLPRATVLALLLRWRPHEMLGTVPDHEVRFGQS